MNTTRRLTHFTTIAAVSAAAVLAAGFLSVAPKASTPVVTLETVVITGHRDVAEAMPLVIELPTVVVIGKRAPSATVVAQKATLKAVAKAAV